MYDVLYLSWDEPWSCGVRGNAHPRIDVMVEAVFEGMFRVTLNQLKRQRVVPITL